MLYIVSYDIVDTGRRNRVAGILKDFGTRVQKSVFECLLDKALLERMLERLKKTVDVEKDSIRIYALCAGCEKTLEIIGRGEPARDEKVYIL